MNQEHFERVFNGLTSRQKEVLRKFLDRETDKVIAQSLHITKPTVRKHIEKICKAFGLKNQPGEHYPQRPELIDLFVKFKPDWVKQHPLSVVSKVDAVKAAGIKSTNTRCGYRDCSSTPDPNFVGREEAITNNYSNGWGANLLLPEQMAYNETPRQGVRCRCVWGRGSLIEQILNRLTDPQEPPILSLSGGAGYGKTEVASQVAKTALHRDLFSEVLWVKARDTELVDGNISQSERDEVLNWNQFLHELAQQLNGCPVERVRQRLKEEKRLIVLDNAETSDIENILAKLVEMLNPSRALLTSRRKTNTPYLGLIPIQGLEESWSYKLLRDEARYKNIPVLLQASNEQLQRVYQWSDGAPLALHFIVGRVLEDQELEPALLALEQANGDVEVFYEFSLKTAWQRISDVAKNVLRYIGRADASVTWEELFLCGGLQEFDCNNARRELKRWYLIEDEPDAKGNLRYNLHPWVRRSLRGGLVDKWQPSLQDLEKKFKWKFDKGS